MPLVTIPKTLEGMNKSEKYILNKLKTLYLSENSISYLYLEPKIKNLTPDFILIDPVRGIIIIEVKAWSIDYIDTINNKSILTTKNETLENPLAKARRYYNMLEGLFRFTDELLDEKGKLKFTFHSIIAFTQLKKEEAVNHKFETFFNHYPARAIYKEELKKIELDSLFNNKIKAIEPILIDAIRASIFPEIKIIPSSYVLTQPFLDENIVALDIEQERFSKNIPFGHYMITGIPGSGKTVALISRAIYLSKLFPDWKILILTYNKVLQAQLKNKIEVIQNDLNMQDIQLTNIEVLTFHQKAMNLSSLSPQNYRDKNEFWKNILPNDAIKNATPTYDVILVDEYQDFYKNWFQLILNLIKEHKDSNQKWVKNLFLAGDRLQSIYNPNEINWRQDIGLDMRGRSKLLKTSYRITKEHIELGLSFLINDKLYKDEVQKFYENGQDIMLKNLTSNSIEILEGNDLKIIQKIQELFESYSAQEILLLAPTWNRVNKIKSALPSKIQEQIISSKEILNNHSIFTTYHSSKGIESKVVIVIDADKIQERKLLYVASTRASSKLILHGISFKNTSIGEEIIKILDMKCA